MTPMAKTTHTYLLLDTRGRFRAETQAASSSAAAAAFRKSRKGRQIPKGWTVYKSPSTATPEPPQSAIAILPPAPPRPFQVGDRIRILANHWAVRSEGYFPAGTVLRLASLTGPSFRTEPFTAADGRYFEGGMAFTPSEYRPDEVELAEPAPTEQDALVAGAVAHLQDLAAQFQDALGMPEAGWPDLIARARGLVRQAEEDRTEAILNRERAEASERDARACAGERDDAMGRLADLRAIYRVADLIPDWDPIQMDDAVRQVLDR